MKRARALAWLVLPPLLGTPPSPPPAPGPPPAVSRAPGSVVTAGINVARTGEFTDPGLVPPLVPRWRLDGVRADLGILAADGRVFLLTRDRVTAVRATDGRILWHRRLADRIVGGAYDGGRVLVGTFSGISALDAGSGRVAWSRVLGQVAFVDPPVAEGGTVYVDAEQGGARMFALSVADGSQRWATDTPDVPDGSGGSALDAAHLYVGGACAQTAALDRGTGATVWTFKTGCSGGGEVVAGLHDGRVYVPDAAYPASTGVVLGAADGHPFGSIAALPFVFADGQLVQVAAPSGRLTAYDPAGRRRWRATKAALPVASVNHDVYAVKTVKTRRTPQGVATLAAYDSRNGQTLWTMPPITPPISALTPRTGLVVGASPGLLIVSDGSRTRALQSVFRPAAAGIGLGASGTDVLTGAPTQLQGVLGTGLRHGDSGRPRLEAQVAPWHHGRFGHFDAPRAERDGGFATGAVVFRNLRFRIRLGRRHSHPVTIYAYPRVTLGRPVAVGRHGVRQRVLVRTPRVRLAGRAFVLYLQRHGHRTIHRLGAARLHAAGRGRARATLRFPVPRHTSERGLLVFCLPAQLREALGRPSQLLRRCGARRITLPR